MIPLSPMAVIANPASQNGSGRAAAQRVSQLLAEALGPQSFTLHLTERPRHAVDLAEKLDPSCKVVVVVGGDGVIHEVVNGLMRRPQAERPALAVVPVGSGNDFAYTLGMSAKVDRAVAQILQGEAQGFDVGCCNGEYFAQTLSFGLDAAIALDTVERRRRTGRTGTLLYAESGIDQLLHHLDTVRYEADLTGGRHLSGESITFAVQNGPTYGGHFKICPEAVPYDGLLDVCLAHPPVSPLSALGIFLLAKEGLHVRSKRFEFHRTRSLRIEFDREPAVQIDGEKLTGRSFSIECAPGALTVLVGRPA